jgi:Tfp pilus assembly protein FimT
MVISILESAVKRPTLAKLTVLWRREVPLIDGFMLNELLIGFAIVAICVVIHVGGIAIFAQFLIDRFPLESLSGAFIFAVVNALFQMRMQKRQL